MRKKGKGKSPKSRQELLLSKKRDVRREGKGVRWEKKGQKKGVEGLGPKTDSSWLGKREESSHSFIQAYGMS